MDEIQWTREVPLLNNAYMVMDVLFVLLFSGGGLGAILVLIMGFEEILAILRIVTIASGALIVLAFVTMGFVMMNDLEMTFTLNEKGIQTDINQKKTRFNKVALVFGLLAGKPGLMGTSMLAMSREQSFVEWSSIQKAVMDDRKKVISLSSSLRLLSRLYCNSETYMETVEFVEKMIPEVEMKHI